MQERQNEIKIDPVKLVAVRGEEIILLSPTELRILSLFIAKKGQVIDRKAIHENMMTAGTGAFSNLVDVYVNYLRKKIGKEMITTVRKGGYVYNGFQEVAA